MKLWVVGQKKGEDTLSWGFEGVFDSEQKAIDACREDDYFIGPIYLNRSCEDAKIWDGAYCPRLETKEEGAVRLEKIKNG